MLGAGLEVDNADGFRAAALASIGIGNDTWLSGSASTTSITLPLRGNSDIRFADIELDHNFEPLGFSIGAGYWGDADILDSVDLRTSVYFRSDRFSLAGEYEARDFDFIIPETDLFVGREIAFTADGIGMRARVRFSDRFSVGLSAMQYDYSVNFSRSDNRDAERLITVSRLGLINNLVDDRAAIDFGIDAGAKHWEFNLSTWKGALDQARTRSFTLRFLTSVGGRSDIEFGIGYDDSDLYGDVTYFSVYWYFYGS